MGRRGRAEVDRGYEGVIRLVCQDTACEQGGLWKNK